MDSNIQDFFVAPFQATNFKHRERNFDPESAKQLRETIYVLTDVDEFNDPVIIPHCKAVLSSLDGLSDEEIGQSVFYVFFRADEDCLVPLRRIIRCGGIFIPPTRFAKVPYWRTTGQVKQSIDESEQQIGTVFGGVTLHENICQAVEMTKDVPGDFVEIGVFTGSSACTALTFMRNRGIRRQSWLLDTFEGFNYAEAEKSPDAIWAGTHLTADPTQTHMAAIDKKLLYSLQPYQLVKNNICVDPLPEQIQKIALANIDVDMYEAILAALHKVSPLMAQGGIIICEDAASTPGLYGAYVAMHDFLDTDEGKKYLSIYMRDQYFLIRIKE